MGEDLDGMIMARSSVSQASARSDDGSGLFLRISSFLVEEGCVASVFAKSKFSFALHPRRPGLFFVPILVRATARFRHWPVSRVGMNVECKVF